MGVAGEAQGLLLELAEAVVAELDGGEVDDVALGAALAQEGVEVAGVEAELLEVGAVVVDDLAHELVVAGEAAQVGFEAAEGVEFLLGVLELAFGVGDEDGVAGLLGALEEHAGLLGVLVGLLVAVGPALDGGLHDVAQGGLALALHVEDLGEMGDLGHGVGDHGDPRDPVRERGCGVNTDDPAAFFWNEQRAA